MSFVLRQINLEFSKNGEVLLPLEGLKCTALISNPGGSNAFATLQLRVYSMTLDQMNQFSSGGANLIINENIDITILAGDVGGTIGQIFFGGIFSSYIDFSAVPEVAFVCSAQSGIFQKASPSAANSWKGSQNVEDIVKSLAESIGMGFSNNGAHAIVQNQYAYGSVFDQVKRVCGAASIPFSIEDNTISIWANDGTKNKTVVSLSKEMGLVGYPSYYQSGLIVKSIYNPDISIGCTIDLTSIIPKANGKFPILGSTHELSTLTPDGPWFTTAQLAPTGTFNVPKN